MTDAATLQTRLDQAEAALHALSIGSQRQSISFDGKSMTYTAANIADLRTYIMDLKTQLGQMPRRRPMGVVFR